MEQEELKRFLSERGHSDTVLFEDPSYSSAFEGVDFDGRAVYNYEKMIQYLVEKDGMTEEDAVEFIEYNTIRSLLYQENPPIILFDIQNMI